MTKHTSIFIGALLLVLLADQALRFVTMQRGVSWRAGTIELGYCPNDGAIFSWPVPGSVMTAISLVILAGLAVLLVRVGWRRGEWFALGVLTMMSGGLMNAVDRLRFGSVVDYLSFGQWFPIFNVADVCIVVGLVMVFLAGALDAHTVDR